MRDEALSTDAGEARREARMVSRGSGSYSGTQAQAPVNAGTMESGQWVPYGRLGITTFGQGFRLRGD